MRSPSRIWVRASIAAAALAIAGLAPAAALGAPQQASPRKPGNGESRRAAKVGAAVRTVISKYGIPGVIVGVWQRGEAPIVEAFGSRTLDLATGRIGPPDMNPDLFMRIGSETKTFTATAVLRLVEEGKVGLEDPISKYVKGVPNGNSITIRELGEMRSGLVDFS